jgi:hypothetical protein
MRCRELNRSLASECFHARDRMRTSRPYEVAAVLAGTVVTWAYTAAFVLVAGQTSCLFALAPPLYYWPQRLVGVLLLAGQS